MCGGRCRGTWCGARRIHRALCHVHTSAAKDAPPSHVLLNNRKLISIHNTTHKQNIPRGATRTVPSSYARTSGVSSSKSLAYAECWSGTAKTCFHTAAITSRRLRGQPSPCTAQRPPVAPLRPWVSTPTATYYIQPSSRHGDHTASSALSTQTIPSRPRPRPRTLQSHEHKIKSAQDLTRAHHTTY